MIFFRKTLSLISNFFTSVWGKIKNVKLNTIRSKLMVSFAVIIIPIIILGLVSYSISAKAIEQKVTLSMSETMKQTGNYMNLLFTNMDDLSFQIFGNADIQSFLESSDQDIKEKMNIANKYLNNIAQTNKFIYSISLIGNGKRTYTSGDYTISNFDLSFMKQDELYKRVGENRNAYFMGSHSVLDTTANSKALRYSTSVVRSISSMKTGDVTGVLFLDVKLNDLIDVLKQVDFGQGSEIHLISPDGRDLSPSFSTEVNQSANLSAFLDQEFFTEIVNGDTIEGHDFITYNKTDYLMVYNKVGKTGYQLLSLIPKSSLLTDAKKIQSITLVLVLVAGIFAIGIGLFISGGMSKTIRNIINAADLAASGDMTVSASTNRSDEFGILTQSINKMISKTRNLIEKALIISEQVEESSETVAITSQSVALSSSEIERAIQEISEGAMAQATDAEQSVHMITELSNMINQVTLNTQKIEKLSDETKSFTGEGIISIEDLEMKARATTENTHLIFGDIQSLDDQSKSIGKIVEVIRKIVDQTNLLALNAAIEAARAGEAGRGFAVVADEVRKLAEQSKSATREIVSIIESTQLQTEKAVKRTAEVEETLQSQNDAVANTISMFKKISNAMESLSDRVNDITTNVGEIGKYKEQTILSIQNISAVSEETAASSEEVTASTGEQTSSINELANNAKKLGDAAQNLSKAINKFKIK